MLKSIVGRAFSFLFFIFPNADLKITLSRFRALNLQNDILKSYALRAASMRVCCYFDVFLRAKYHNAIAQASIMTQNSAICSW